MSGELEQLRQDVALLAEQVEEHRWPPAGVPNQGRRMSPEAWAERQQARRRLELEHERLRWLLVDEESANKQEGATDGNA